MKIKALFLLCGALFLSQSQIANASDYGISIDNIAKPSAHVLEQRQAFVKARDAIKKGDNSLAISYKKGILKDYPLNVWLDYYMLSARPQVSKFNDVLKFINSKQHKELSSLLENKYIDFLAREGQFKKVNVLLPTKPYLDNEAIYNYQKSKLCRFYEAKLHLQQANEEALTYAQSLFVSLKSYPSNCAPLINILDSKGYITDKLLLQKFENAFIKRGYEDTTKDLAKQLENSSFKDRVAMQMDLYDDPKAIFSKDFKATSNNAKIAVLAFKRYINLSSEDARFKLKTFEKKFKPSSVDLLSIKQLIAETCLYKSRPYSDVEWVDKNLPAVGWTDELKEQRIRRAIWYSQWKIVYQMIDHMPSTFQEQINWRYWKGHAAKHLGYKKQGMEILREVAKDRSFFGFLAAQELNLPYAYNHLKLDEKASFSNLLKNNLAVQRFFELEAINDENSIFEWREIAKSSSDEDAMLMAQWALQTGKVRYAIESVIAANRWDALSYRFPIAYLEIYKDNSKNYNVALSFLYGVSRQESMLNADIRSPVGAIGLMQIMPTTAKVIARKNKWQYKSSRELTNPETNVKFGSYYLRSLLDRFDNNRILAAAGYNAGPNRASFWLSKDGKHRNAAQYIETIPFLETRKYVQNVILYDAMYYYLLTGRKQHLLFKNELNYKY